MQLELLIDITVFCIVEGLRHKTNERANFPFRTPEGAII